MFIFLLILNTYSIILLYIYIHQILNTEGNINACKYVCPIVVNLQHKVLLERSSMPCLWVWHLSCLPWFPKQVEDLTRNGIWAKCPPDHQQAARWGSSQVKRAQYFCLEIPGSIGSVVGSGEICAKAAKCTNENGVGSELKLNNGSAKL